MLRGIQQLVNADAYPGFNALSDGINTALDGVEIVEQVGRLAKQVAPGLGQFNAASDLDPPSPNSFCILS